jgi:hypothetical protein
MTQLGRRPWSIGEDDMLRKLARAGESAVSISKKLNREPTPVRKRAQKLNIVLAKSRWIRGLPRK